MCLHRVKIAVLKASELAGTVLCADKQNEAARGDGVHQPVVRTSNDNLLKKQHCK
jgi:hypothetical protein